MHCYRELILHNNHVVKNLVIMTTVWNIITVWNRHNQLHLCVVPALIFF